MALRYSYLAAAALALLAACHGCKSLSHADASAWGETRWGPSVEGLQCRLRAERRTWRADETPAFNFEMCRRFGVLPLDFDGEHDSQMHPYNSSNQRHMEYVKQRGEFDDLPYEELVADMVRMYPQLVAVSDGKAGDFDGEAIDQPAS